MAEKNTITLREYIKKENGSFVVPYYQRGYVWGKKREDEGKDSVTKLTKQILEKFENKSENKRELFLQGVTVAEKNGEVVIIDGQQRTTYFYLLLRYLGCNERFSIRYEGRKETEKFIEGLTLNDCKKLVDSCCEDKEENLQDLYFMKKTVRIIDKELSELSNQERSELSDYVLTYVKFLYIPLSSDISADGVFSMMNGNRAVMTTEELIKAELLRRLYREEKGNVFDYDVMRGRYAREWDRWLYWWKREDVRAFYHISTTDDGTLDFLLTSYMLSYTGEEDTRKLKYETFCVKCFNNQEEHQLENTFYGLRRLQKRFEDVYNSVGDKKEFHNKIGAILTVHDNENRKRFIQWYFYGKKIQDEDLEKYYRYAFLGLSHNIIRKAIENYPEGIKEVEGKITEVRNALSSRYVYKNYPEYAFKQLLRMNIDEDNKLGRRFNFSIYDKRSLEHIYPKSMVFYEGDGIRGDGKSLSATEIQEMKSAGYLKGDEFSQDCSEHCIGNLVLLGKNDNSQFSNKSFEEKKKIYFNPETPEAFESRNLLHSMLVFSNSSWGIEEIKENKRKYLYEYNKCYKPEDVEK